MLKPSSQRFVMYHYLYDRIYDTDATYMGLMFGISYLNFLLLSWMNKISKKMLSAH